MARRSFQINELWVANDPYTTLRAAIAATSPIGWWDAGRDLYTNTGLTTPVTADGDTVAGWKDQSGNGYHLTQATAGNRPVYRPTVATLNNKPGVEFTAASSHILSRNMAGIIANLNVYNIVVVYRSTMVGNGYFYAEGNVSNGTPLVGIRLATAAALHFHRDDASTLASPTGGTTANDGAVHITTIRRIASNNWSLRQDGTQLATAAEAPTTTTIENIAIGARLQASPNLPVTAHIAQVLVYSAEQYAAAESALGKFYGVTLP